MRFGTNYHLDSLRPWTRLRGTARDVRGIASAGFDLVRVVGELVLPTGDGRDVADGSLWREVEPLCADTGLSVLALCWNVVSDEATDGRPLVDASGRQYRRGHWGLFNFMDPELRRVALESLRTMARAIRSEGSRQVVTDFQPTNEWLLAAYPPQGWDWPSYAGAMTRGAPVPVMYDAASLEAWKRFVGDLPEEWRAKVLSENPELSPPDLEATGWSPTALAWVEHRAALIGDFLRDVYDAVKPLSEGMALLSQSTMPVLANWSGRYLSSMGHNPDYWFRRGRSCDHLAVNTYDNYYAIREHPALGDNSLELWSWLTLFSEVVRVHELDGLYVTEIGGNSYWHSEDAQRYLVMRSILAAAAFEPATICHLLWNDEPKFEGINEQFFGAARDQHLQPKPVLDDLRSVMAVVRGAGQREEEGPRLAVVLPRRSLDVGLEPAPTDVLALGGRCTVLTTEDLIDRGGLPPRTAALLVAGAHHVGGLHAVQAAERAGVPAIVPATLGRFGVDDDAAREQLAGQLLGLVGQRRFNQLSDPVVLTSDTPGRPPIEFSGEYPSVEITEADLAEGSVVLARFAAGGVAAYRFGDVTVSALPLGEPVGTGRPEMTAFLRLVAPGSAPTATDATTAVVEDSTDGRMETWCVGDVLVAVNTSDRDGRVTVRAGSTGLTASLDVAARRFSAVRLSATPDLAYLSGPGEVTLGESFAVATDAPAGVLLRDGSLTVSPRWSTEGCRVTGVAVNGRAAQARDVGGREVFAVDIHPAPRYEVTVGREQRVRGRITYQRDVQLWPPVNPEDPPNGHVFGDVAPDRDHTLFAPADEAVLEMHCSCAVPHEVAVRLVRIADMRSTVVFDRAVSTSSVGSRTPVPGLAERGQCRIHADVSPGVEETCTGLHVALAYRSVAAPVSMVSRIGDGMLRASFLHPMAREHDRPVATDVQLLTRGTWEPAHLHIGAPGMHTRHLDHSEDWIDISD